ncbi:hypothetical protein [Kitasatospora sp. MAP5-34]|uniref:hypothetical protein n=1 Tax=Kitasatospora sp. MAP5-34 TaxID=3035102 RepID=UPI002476680E|nr:hypothetical protein [Kitasatospora sp. MAP5-34]MDH6574562.1 hypothetical protein [Kitasatospora sp. MAP5-34]
MRRAALWLAPALLLVPFTASCDPAGSGSFDAQPSTPSPTCLAHQTGTPDKRYTGGENSDPLAVLELMRFYTANGTKVFCDGRPPTEADKRWTTLYVTLGGDPVHLGQSH